MSISPTGKIKYVFNLVFLIVIFSFVYAITRKYISEEKFIYSWDYIGYQKSTDILIGEFQKSFLRGILEFIKELFADYSKIFCIPILPVYLALGQSRLAFILSLAMVYITSFSLIMGVVFSKLVLKNHWIAFWLSTFITLVTPSVWISVLRGYPDIGGASIFMLGILLYWKDTTLKQKGQILRISSLMSILVLFRRHFAYAFRSFIMTVILQSIINICLERLKNKNISSLNFGVIKRALILLSLFLLISIHLVIKTFYFNYRELYSSYEENIFANIKYYGTSFGSIFIFLAIAGLALGLKYRNFDSKKIGFLSLLGIVSVVQWLFSSKQLGVHYASHFLPFIILGISSLIWSTGNLLKEFGDRYKYDLVGTTILLEVFLLIFNFSIGIGNISLDSQPLETLFARSEIPLVRSDYSEVTRFIKYFKENSSSEDSIYVAASSYGILNKSILEEAEKNLYKEQKINIIRTSDIDSRDFYPINGLLDGTFVVVTDPTQYHINPNEQKVITVVGDIFRNNLLIANDFERVDEKFLFDKGVTVYIYRRVRDTSIDTILSTLRFMENKINRKLGRETYWLTLNSAQTTVIERDALFKTTHISPLFVRSGFPASLLYFGEISKKTKVNGKINIMSDCSKINSILLHAKTLDSDKTLIEEKTLSYVPKAQMPFYFTLNGKDASFIELDLEPQNNSNSSSTCMIALNHIVVSN